MENTLISLEARLKRIEELLSPLYLLNIFDLSTVVRMGCEIPQLDSCISNFNNFEEIRISNYKHVEQCEKCELEAHAKKAPNDPLFVPSKELLSALLKLSSALALREESYKKLEKLREIYIELLSGKISITQARSKSKTNEPGVNISKIEDTFYMPEYFVDDIKTNRKISTEVRKEFKEIYSMFEKRWVDGKWRDRLKFYEESDSITS